MREGKKKNRRIYRDEMGTGKTGHTKVHKAPHKREVDEEKECGIKEEKAIKQR